MSVTATEIAPLAVVPPPAVETAPRETVIEPRRGWIAVDWGELVRQRELLMFLIWRDIKVRYKQATLGVAWAVLQPLTQVLIFSLIFGSGFNFASRLGGQLVKAYPVFVFAGLLPWQCFARSLQEGGMSLVNQQHLLTKIYFPRLFVPTASVGGAVFDLLIALPIFAAAMAVFHVTPPWTVVFLPLLIGVTVMMASGFAYLLAALTVTYRDFRFIIPFLVQIWMWVSFVMIPVPDAWMHQKKWQLLFYLNPMYGLVNAYRKALLGLDLGWNPWHLVVSVATAAAAFVLGVFYFRRTERRFADIA